MGNYNYHCFNTQDRDKCDSCSKAGQVVIEEEGEFQCPCDGSSLKLIGELNGCAAIKTPTRNRFLDVDRKKRNRKHFEREVLPTMDSDSKRHHLSKIGKK
jgi:hypothetical protein